MTSGRRVLGVVLCGGASSRMGTDKARLRVGERSLLEVALDALDPVCDSVALATGPAPRYAELQRPIALDDPAHDGPLAGLCAGLRHAAAEGGADWIVSLACDMPRASSAVLTRLLDRAEQESLDVCLLETPLGVEPLCGVYSARCLAPVEHALAAGERRMIAFHDSVRVGTLHESELPRAAQGSAINLNTPEDLASERRTA